MAKKSGQMAKNEIKSGQTILVKTPDLGLKRALFGCFRAHKYPFVTKLAKNPLFLL
ncbi:hypothetical protein SEA_GIANTSBANE_90 [Arthrobacter phage Giantsbane]|nr:hypothetical protein SEA_GIANTSBANE_90 [Arthrobacter phage Giantsbane]